MQAQAPPLSYLLRPEAQLAHVVADPLHVKQVEEQAEINLNIDFIDFIYYYNMINMFFISKL